METKLKQLLKTIKLNESMLSMVFGVVTVLLIGILVLHMYNANNNKPVITQEAEQTAAPAEKVGEVAVETKEDGKQYPTSLPDTVKVEKGDNLWMIAQKQYGSGYNWVDIAKENGLKNPGMIKAGQELKLPKSAVKVVAPVAAVKPHSAPVKTIEGDSYTVVKGDYLWSIALRAYGDGFKWVEIAKSNNIDLNKASYIEIGQVLKLPR